MTTRTFTIPAISPIITFEPQPDLNNAPWKSDQGGSTNGNISSGQPARVLQGTGRVTYQTFGTGLGISGAISGDFCSYTATLEKGDGNSRDSSTLPAAQTSSPVSGMLASFTGLPVDNWGIKLEASCSAGASAMKVFGVVTDAWVGNSGDTVSNTTLDDMSSSLQYSNAGVDWSNDGGLAAPFYNDTQHYTSVNGAHVNFTFSGTGIVAYGSNDPMHGPYTANLVFAGDSYDSQTPATYTGYNPFLAVPVPIFLATGLDPTKKYTLIIENQPTNGSYLDLDYLQVFMSNGGPPSEGGGTNIIKSPSSGSKKSNMAAIIGGAVGGGVLLLLLLLLAVFFWKRRKIKVSSGGPRPLDDGKASSMGHVIPLQTHTHGSMGNMAAIPFGHSPYTRGAPGSHSFVGYQPVPHSGSFDGGYGSPMLAPHPIPGAAGAGMVGGAAAGYAASSNTSSYDPYAGFGGNHPSHPGTAYTGTNTMVSGAPTDPVMARRQGKAAEIEAARLRVNNQGSLPILSPTATHPTTMSTTTPSIDASSQYDSSAPLHPSQYKTPDDPPPQYQ